MRGDPPVGQLQRVFDYESTPHARGSTRTKQGHERSDRVYPACAGIHPYFSWPQEAFVGLPRMRGDPPLPQALQRLMIVSTPHARGSTSFGRKGRFLGGVYPACAGIHPLALMKSSLSFSLPRMRGDPPYIVLLLQFFEMSTPHARGSTLSVPGELTARAVYPACAGIHPQDCAASYGCGGLPRMRGDPPTTP